MYSIRDACASYCNNSLYCSCVYKYKLLHNHEYDTWFLVSFSNILIIFHPLSVVMIYWCLSLEFFLNAANCCSTIIYVCWCISQISAICYWLCCWVYDLDSCCWGPSWWIQGNLFNALLIFEIPFVTYLYSSLYLTKGRKGENKGKGGRKWAMLPCQKEKKRREKMRI